MPSFVAMHDRLTLPDGAAHDEAQANRNPRLQTADASVKVDLSIGERLKQAVARLEEEAEKASRGK
jgi:hypothetical protein